jgi:hypothetical protein
LATTLDTLVQRVRRFMRDYPAPASALTISLSTSAASITVSDTSVLPANYVVEIDYEALLVTASVSSTVVNVMRGWAGTTAASHLNSSSILIRPGFMAVEIIDALNAAKDEMYPYVYKPVLDTSLSSDDVTYEFTIPSTIKHLSKVDLLVTGDTAYRPVTDWTVLRAGTPKLKFKRAPVGGTLRLHGFGPFDDLSASGDTVDTLFPANAERPLVLGAASRLLGSAEAGRTRVDVGLRDDREAANRPGGALTLANQLERRFEKALLRAAMPPLPVHVTSVL